MGILKEFREFAMRGNVIDLAVGVVIGGAFGKIVSSLVGDIIMPLVSTLTGGVSFTEMVQPLGVGDKAAVLKYGNFIQTVVDFTIVAFSIFVVVKLINMARKKFEREPEAAEASPPPENILLLREIRDALQRTAPRRVE